MTMVTVLVLVALFLDTLILADFEHRVKKMEERLNERDSTKAS